MTMNESENLQHCCAPFKHVSMQYSCICCWANNVIHNFKQCCPKVGRYGILHARFEYARIHHVHAHTRFRSEDP